MTDAVSQLEDAAVEVAPSAPTGRATRRVPRAVRSTLIAVASFASVLGLYEAYRRWFGDWLDTRRDVGTVFGFKLLPRSSELAMPALGEVFREFGEPEVAGRDGTVLESLIRGGLTSLWLAVLALLLGSLFGLLAATVMARFRVMERGLMPYLVISQTVPLIALAPLTQTWGGEISLFGYDWQKWNSAVVLGAFLSFFPIAVGALRGFRSPNAAALELMDSYAAGWWRTFFKLRLPAARSFLSPALRLASSAAVFGVIVSEISVGYTGGIGYDILSYLSTGRSVRVFTSVFGTVLVGLAMAGIVTMIDRVLTPARSSEVPA